VLATTGGLTSTGTDVTPDPCACLALLTIRAWAWFIRRTSIPAMSGRHGMSITGNIWATAALGEAGILRKDDRAWRDRGRPHRARVGWPRLDQRQVDDEVRADAMAEQSIKAMIDPKDIAALAMFLASDAGKSISGQVLPIDSDRQRA